MENLNAEQVIQGLRDNDSPYKSDQDNIVSAISLIKSQEQRIKAQDMTISELRQACEKSEHDVRRYQQKIKELTTLYEIEHLRVEAEKAYTLSDINTRFALHFGTYTNDAEVKVSEVFQLLKKIEKEILEDN